MVKLAESIHKCVTHIKDNGENTDEDLIKSIYTDLDILFCEALTDAGIQEDPEKILTPLKHFFAEMQNKNSSGSIQLEDVDQNKQTQNVVEACEIDLNVSDDSKDPIYIPSKEDDLKLENTAAANQILNEILNNSVQTSITDYMVPKSLIPQSQSLPLLSPLQDKKSDDFHELRSEFIALKTSFDNKSRELENKFRSLETKLEKQFWTSGEIKDKFELIKFPEDFNNVSIPFAIAGSFSLTSDIFVLLGFLDAKNSSKMRKEWWDNNVNSKNLSLQKITFLAKNCNHIIMSLNLLWTENISRFSLEYIYLQISALCKLLAKLNLGTWPKSVEINKSLSKIANCRNVNDVLQTFKTFKFFGEDFSSLIHDYNHWKNFESRELESLDSWSQIKFRVNLQGFEEPYVNIFPEQGESHLDEIDSKMSGIGISQDSNEPDSVDQSQASERVMSSDESSDQESPKLKRKKSNYVEPSYSRFWDELDKLGKK